MDRIAPRHLGIIMDGNGRWAQKNGKKRQYGHRKGAMNVERIVEHAFLRGVSVVSLFAFSSENWSRPQEEVDAILNLIRRLLRPLLKAPREKRRFGAVMGDVSALPEDLRESVARVTAGDRRREKHSEYRHQLRRAAGARPRGGKAQAGQRPRHGRDARGRAGYGGAPRAGFSHPYGRRKAAFQLHAVRIRLCGTVFYGRLLAGFRRRGAGPRAGGIFLPFPPLRTSVEAYLC